jgi:hypothetical protein
LKNGTQQPVVFRLADDANGGHLFWCPGCEYMHAFDYRWRFNGDYVAPTVTPSVVSEGFKRCHLFVRDGQLQFLEDSEHELAGQVVPMERPPLWEDDDV